MWLSAVHIPGRLNTGADKKSRVFSDNHQWMLNKHSFEEILLHHPSLDLNLFAISFNHQISSYCFWQADPNSAHADTSTMNWNGLKFYASPPKMPSPKMPSEDQSRPSRGCTDRPTLANLNLVSSPPSTFMQPALDPAPMDRPSATPLPQWPTSTTKESGMVVCPMSGDPSAITTFQRRLLTFS